MYANIECMVCRKASDWALAVGRALPLLVSQRAPVGANATKGTASTIGQKKTSTGLFKFDRISGPGTTTVRERKR